MNVKEPADEARPRSSPDSIDDWTEKRIIYRCQGQANDHRYDESISQNRCIDHRLVLCLSEQSQNPKTCASNAAVSGKVSGLKWAKVGQQAWIKMRLTP